MVCIKPVVHIMDKQVVRAPRRRREHSAEFKRELVARSLEPGVSVAAIAMDSGINANLLFGWRRRHLDALAHAEPATPRPPAAVLLRQAARIEKGSAEPHKVKVASVTRDQVRDIAEIKMPDLNANDVDAAMKIVEGTARSMGITVSG